MKNVFKAFVLAAVALSVTGCASLQRDMAEADARRDAKQATKRAIREGRIGGTGRLETDQQEANGYYNSQLNRKQKATASEGAQ